MKTVIRVTMLIALIIGLTILVVLTPSLAEGGIGVPGGLSGPILVGTNTWLGYEPMYLARELEYFAESDIRLVEYTSATEVLRAFRNETIGVAALTLDEVMLLWQDDIRARVLLVMDISNGGDAILSKPHIESLSGLRGKRVGIEGSAVGAYVISRALSTVQMNTKDITIIPLEVDEHEEAFTNGDVDAVVTFEPVRSHLLATGARLLFDSTQIPGEIVDVLVASDRILEYRTRELKVLLSGWFQALHYLDERPQDAARLMSDRLKLSPSEILNAYGGLKIPDYSENREMFGGDPAGLAETARCLAELMVQENLLNEDFDIEEFVEDSVLSDIAVDF